MMIVKQTTCWLHGIVSHGGRCPKCAAIHDQADRGA